MTTSCQKVFLSSLQKKRKKERKEKKRKILSCLFTRLYRDLFRHQTGPFFLLGTVLQGFLPYSARKAMRILVSGETSFGSEVERQQLVCNMADSGCNFCPHLLLARTRQGFLDCQRGWSFIAVFKAGRSRTRFITLMSLCHDGG